MKVIGIEFWTVTEYVHYIKSLSLSISIFKFLLFYPILFEFNIIISY
jgi:hypothetical protein